MATLSVITDVFIPRTQAFEELSNTVGSPVIGRGTAHPRIELAEQIRLEIEVPKFGEDLPITLDLHGPAIKTLRITAEELGATLHKALGWSCHVHEWEKHHD
jgi:hypothetical protein